MLASWSGRTAGRTCLPAVAGVLATKMGGSSGPLLAEAFRRAGEVFDAAADLGAETVVSALWAAADGIRDRGGAGIGDKTTLDALIPAAELCEEAVTAILATLDLPPGSDVLAFISGLGATSHFEQYLVFGEVRWVVGGAGHRIARRLVGPYLTALDMPGVVITLLHLDNELTELWDAPVRTPALSWSR